MNLSPLHVVSVALLILLVVGTPFLLRKLPRENGGIGPQRQSSGYLAAFWALYAILGAAPTILALLSYATFGDPLIHAILFGGPVLIIVTCMVVAHWLHWKQRGTWAPLIAGLPILLAPLSFWLANRYLDTISAWL